jgi:dethiobiotin synthetase
LEVLNANGILPVGIIFNGEPHQGTEEIILSRCNFSFVGRLLIEKEIDRNTIKKYAQAWKKDLLKALP